VKILISNGADVNAKAYYTALHFASKNGHLEIVKILISNGADVNAKDVSYLFNFDNEFRLKIKQQRMMQKKKDIMKS
jgi:ankyrin repeat protein